MYSNPLRLICGKAELIRILNMLANVGELGRTGSFVAIVENMKRTAETIRAQNRQNHSRY
jgi:hypothetical protein